LAANGKGMIHVKSLAARHENGVHVTDFFPLMLLRCNEM